MKEYKTGAKAFRPSTIEGRLRGQLVNHINHKFVVDETASTQGTLQVPIIFDRMGNERPFLESLYKMGDLPIFLPQGWFYDCPDLIEPKECELTGDILLLEVAPPYRSGHCWMLPSNAYEEALASQQNISFSDEAGSVELVGELSYAAQTTYYGEVEFPNLDILPHLQEFLHLHGGHRLDEDIYHLAVGIPTEVGDPGEDIERHLAGDQFTRLLSDHLIPGKSKALVYCDPSTPVHERDRGGLTVLKTIFYGKKAELSSRRVNELQLLHDCLTTIHPEMKWTLIGNQQYGQGWHTRIIKDEWRKASFDGIKPESIFQASPHARQVWYWSLCLNSESDGYSTLSACGQNLEAGHDPFMNYLQSAEEGGGHTFYLPDDVDNRLDYKTVYADEYPNLHPEPEADEGYDTWHDGEQVDDGFKHYCLYAVPVAEDVNVYQSVLSWPEMRRAIDPYWEDDVQALTKPAQRRYQPTAFHFPPRMVDRFSELKKFTQIIEEAARIITDRGDRILPTEYKDTWDPHGKIAKPYSCKTPWMIKMKVLNEKGQIDRSDLSSRKLISRTFNWNQLTFEYRNFKRKFYQQYAPMMKAWMDKEGLDENTVWKVWDQYWRIFNRITLGRPQKASPKMDITTKKIIDQKGQLVEVPYHGTTTLSASTDKVGLTFTQPEPVRIVTSVKPKLEPSDVRISGYTTVAGCDKWELSRAYYQRRANTPSYYGVWHQQLDLF